MAISKEVFANSASCVAAAGSGGTNGTSSPSSGVTETWTMSTGNTSFPAAQTSSVPNTYFYARDPADTTNEIVLVTDNSTTTSWHVTRGALGTAPVAHASGATYVQVISHGTLQNFKQTPSASVTPVSYNTSLTETLVATYQPTSDELIAGASWEVIAFGSIQTTSSAPTLTWNLRWGGIAGTSILSMVTGTKCPALTASIPSGSSFDFNATVTLIDTTHAVANLNSWWQSTTTTSSGVASNATSVAISGSGPLVLTAKWSASNASNALVIPAPLIFRAA